MHLLKPVCFLTLTSTSCLAAPTARGNRHPKIHEHAQVYDYFPGTDLPVAVLDGTPSDPPTIRGSRRPVTHEHAQVYDYWPGTELPAAVPFDGPPPDPPTTHEHGQVYDYFPGTDIPTVRGSRHPTTHEYAQVYDYFPGTDLPVTVLDGTSSGSPVTKSPYVDLHTLLAWIEKNGGRGKAEQSWVLTKFQVELVPQVPRDE